MVDRAVRRAPTVGDSGSWSLSVQDRVAWLYAPLLPGWHSREAEERDRFLTGGAAVGNLQLAMRQLGWATQTGPEHDPGVVLTVRGSHRDAPSRWDGQLYRAINRQLRYPHAFAGPALSQLATEAIEQACHTDRVRPRWLRSYDEALALAHVLLAARQPHHRQQRDDEELAMWPLIQYGSRAGLFGVEAATTPEQLAAWIADEDVLALVTSCDDTDDQLRAGQAMQHAWLTATSLGLVASIITQPLHLDHLRQQLAEVLSTPETPHLLLRCGYPARIPPPRHTASRP
ncbi:hypothetical protein [Bounagaea algeriensis]